MKQARTNVQSLRNPDNIKRVSGVLRTNIAMCRSMGHSFMPYLGTTYKDMLNVYKFYSQHVKESVGTRGPGAINDPIVRLMCAAKREVLQLVELFIEKSSTKHAATVAKVFLPPLLEPVLVDYRQAIPVARDPGVLSLLVTMVNKLREHMSPHVPVVLEMVFEVTFKMLSGNFEDFPEIRQNFFSLVKAIVYHCFGAIFNIPPQYRVAVVQSIVGAMKHTERIAAETGLDILKKFLDQVKGNESVAQMFYKGFFMMLLREVLTVLTDRLHKSGFPKQAVILKYMFDLVESNRIVVPLREGSTASSENKAFVAHFVMQSLSTMFPKMDKQEIRKFVESSFNVGMTLPQFKLHLHDFLVHTKMWSAEDKSELYVEEQRKALELRKKQEMTQKASVPGLLNPHELDDLDDI